MKNQEASRTCVSKKEDKARTGKELLLCAMVVAIATVLVGSELQMVVADDDESGSEDGSTPDAAMINERESQTASDYDTVGNNDYSGAGSGNEGGSTGNEDSLLSDVRSGNVIGGSGTGTSSSSGSDDDPDQPDQPDQPGSQCDENDDITLQCDEQSP